MPTDPTPVPVEPARVLAALEVLGWPDDRQMSAHVEPDGFHITPAGHYWGCVEDVIRAVDAARTDPGRSTEPDRRAQPSEPPTGDPSLRDRIINAISAHAEGCQDTECRWCDDAFQRADAVLTLVADWLHHGDAGPEPRYEFAAALALTSALPGRIPYGAHGDAEATDAVRAVTRAVAATLRPPDRR